jgi:hypothetical protein
MRNPALTACALVDSGELTLVELWAMYWGEGGRADPMELDAFIHGVPLLDGFEVNILQWALEPLMSP